MIISYMINVQDLCCSSHAVMLSCFVYLLKLFLKHTGHVKAEIRSKGDDTGEYQHHEPVATFSVKSTSVFENNIVEVHTEHSSITPSS